MSHRKSQLSRADLLDVLVAADNGAIAHLSQQLGLTKQLESNENSIIDPTIIDPEPIKHKPPKPKPDTHIKASVGFWLLQKRETTIQQNRPEQISKPAPLVWSMQNADLPVHHLLTSPRSLLARLFHHLKHQRASREIDIDAIVKKISRGEHLLRLPRSTRRSLGKHLHIIDDRQLHLTPYWRDHYLFSNLIASLLPDYASSRALLQNGQLLPVSLTHKGELTDWELPPKGSVVLIFSDLGALAMQPDRLIDTWLNIARILQSQDCKCVLLVPCHPNECDWRLKSFFTIESWENRQHLKPCTQTQRQEQAEKLLMLLSPAIRLEPSLLRGVRKSLAQQGN